MSGQANSLGQKDPSSQVLPGHVVMEHHYLLYSTFCHPLPARGLAVLGSAALRVSLGETFSSTLWLPNPQRVD